MVAQRAARSHKSGSVASRQRNREDRRALVGILVGSQSDWPTMSAAAEVLAELGVPFEARILSAHRTPEATLDYALTAEERGLEAIIAGAGMAAHLPGIVAAMTALPVLGVPLEAGGLGGLDALLAIVQMPKGVPVATFAVGKAGAGNAALFAANLLGATRPELRGRLRAWRAARAADVLALQVPASDVSQSTSAMAAPRSAAEDAATRRTTGTRRR